MSGKVKDPRTAHLPWSQGYRGRSVWDEERIKSRYQPVIAGDECEGYVVRLAGAFPFDAFGTSVGKFVRPAHVQTDQPWMHQPTVVNELRRGDRPMGDG